LIENENCEICGLPIEKVRSNLAAGVDYDGLDALFTIDTLHCAVGHRYQKVDESETIKR
jgi:hypothetical protein